MILNVISAHILNFSFASIIHEHSIIFIIGILTFALSVMLLSATMVVIQTGILLLFYAVDGSDAGMLTFFLIAFQVLFGLFTLFKYIKAIHYFNDLVLEKTHHIPPKITKNGNPGTRRPF